MNEIRVFENKRLGNVRAVEIDGEPWFVGKDVAVALGYLKPREALATNVDDEDKIMGASRVAPIPDSLGRVQYPTMINESGLYSLTFGSKLPTAREFKRWITHEVIPSIRKTGGYSAGRANPFAAMIPQDYPSALRALADECEKNQKLEAKIALDAPKTRFADCVADSPELSYVSELAKVLKQNGVNIGRTRVFEWLREHEYIMKTGSKYNEPTQKAMNRKLFHVVKDRFGNAITKMTQKGFIVLLNEIMDDYTGQNQMAII